MERRDFIKEQMEITETKVEVAKAGLTSMFVGVLLLWILLITIAIVL